MKQKREENKIVLVSRHYSCGVVDFISHFILHSTKEANKFAWKKYLLLPNSNEEKQGNINKLPPWGCS